MKQFLIIGGGGHSASVISAIEDKTEIHGILNSFAKGDILGVPIIGNDSLLPDLLQNGINYFHVAIGDNSVRHKKFEECTQKGMSPVTVIDKTAAVDTGATFGAGCFIGKNAVVNARASIGHNCIINSGSIIEHDCKIMESTHCAPGSVLCGNVHVGRLCLIGANVTIFPGIRITDGVTIGAGSVVTKDLTIAGIYVGSPAKLLAKKEEL